ncbi:hypothetical protein [Nitrosomonas supralitoralis]|uniref:Uncharacterized protein n=1 Tax=Nitrosomonas supralitoralis TaxID=2116706 RepID=A0A2P7NQW8_9PROT|nr:hypothetical protein [Nitrosomonas supralitoralis]PSJ15862.1 hypothetical protein C7H79_16705 [Nitrosomonas supralitoralis]
MAVSNSAYLKQFHEASKAMGAKIISSDFTFEVDGFEQNYLLAKQVPWAIVSPAGEIEVPGPLGMASYQPQQAKTYMQGQVAFEETIAGSIDNMLVNLLTGGGRFNATVYEGTPQKFLRAKRYIDCFVQIDNPDRDWENRSQIMIFTGTLFFHYFGEIIPGNSLDYT